MMALFDNPQNTGQPFPNMPTPVAAGGFGGFGGGNTKGLFADVLGALGHSLLTGTQQNPLGGFAIALDGLTDRRRDNQEAERERASWGSAFGQLGMEDPQLQELAQANPQAARLVYEQRMAEKQRQQEAAERQQAMEADAAYTQQLIGGNTDPMTMPVGVPVGPVDRALIGAGGGTGSDWSAAPPDLQAPTPKTAQAMGASDPIATGAAAPSGNAERQKLMAQRDFYVRAAAAARSPQQLGQAKLFIDSVDAKIKMLDDGQGKGSLINAGDGRLFDPNTREWITAPSDGNPEFRRATPEEAASYGARAGQFGKDGRFYPINPPSGMTIEADGQGGFRMVQGSGAGESEGGGGNVNQNLNAGFLVRGRDSNSTITDLEDQGTSMWNKTMRNMPGGFGNYGLNPQAQKFEQAKRDFINAVLRRESGAVIADEEFSNADQQYFPQPGDSAEVIEQKRQNRANAVKAFEFSAGPAAPAAPVAPPASTPKSRGISEQDYLDLPSGAQFTAPDGSIRRKP